MKVLFWGVLADVCGVHEVERETPLMLDALKEEMLRRYPELKNYNFQIAVNNALTAANQSLQPQDEIAFLPPFAGG